MPEWIGKPQIIPVAAAPMFVASRPNGTERFRIFAQSMDIVTNQAIGRIKLSAPTGSGAVPWQRPWRTSYLYVRVAPGFVRTGAGATELLAAECEGLTCATANFRVMYDDRSVMVAYGRYPTCNSGAACFPVTPAAMKQYGATVVVSVSELEGLRVVSMSVIVNCAVVARYQSEPAPVNDADQRAAPQLVPSNPDTTRGFTVVADAAVSDVALLAHIDALDGSSWRARDAIEDFLHRKVRDWISTDASITSRTERLERSYTMSHLCNHDVTGRTTQHAAPFFIPRQAVSVGSVTMYRVRLSVGEYGCWHDPRTPAPQGPRPSQPVVAPQLILRSPLKAPMLLAWRATAAGGFSVCANTDKDLVSARPAVGRGEIQMQYAAAGYVAPQSWDTCHLVVRVMPMTVTGKAAFAILTMGAAPCAPGAPCALTGSVPSFQLRYDPTGGPGKECLLFGDKTKTLCVRVPKARVEAGLTVIVSCATRGANRRATLAAGDGTYHSVLLAPGAPSFIPSTLVSTGKFLIAAGKGVSDIALIAHHGQTDDASRRDIERFFYRLDVPQPVLGFLLAAAMSAHIWHSAYSNVNSCCPTVGLSAIRPAGKPTDKWPGFDGVVAKSRFVLR